MQLTNLESIIHCIQNDQSIDNDLKLWLSQQKQQNSAINFNRFFESMRIYRKVIANIRQLTNVLIRIIPHEAVVNFLQGKRISYGMTQVIAEFFEFLSLFYQQKHLLTEMNISKMSCSVIGMAALTITTFGIDSIPILAAANALRGLTNFIKLLIRRMENKQKLITIAQRLNDIRKELLECCSDNVKKDFCLEYIKLKYEFERCSYFVNSTIISCSEGITLAANLLLIVGAILTAFPATAGVGLLLITISTAARFLVGIPPIVGELKSQYPKIVEKTEDFNENTSCLQQSR